VAIRALTFATIMLATQSASADPPPHWDFGLVIAGGAESIADNTVGQVGIGTWLGRRITADVSITLRAELLTSNMDAPDGSLILGETTRGLLGIDWRLYENRHPFVPEVFVNAGIGRELTAWDRGTVGRQLVFVGAEARQGFDIPQGRAIRGVRRMGMPFGVRFQLAPAIDSMTIARACSQCGAPPQAHADFAFLIYYGLDFSR
jgi:hypothetical protein